MDKRLMESPWWHSMTRGETGSCSYGEVLTSKSLIKLPLDGRGCIPSLIFDLRMNYGRSSEGNSDLLLLYSLFSSVQFSCSVVSDSLWSYESQHTRPPCPSPTPGVHSNSCPSSRWCYPAISGSVIPFSSCPQTLPTSGSFPVSQLFAWGGQSIGISALASVLPVNTQDWSPLGWTGWISLQSKGLSRSSTPQFKSINSSVLNFLHSPTLTSIHDHWKNHSLDQKDHCSQSNVSVF